MRIAKLGPFAKTLQPGGKAPQMNYVRMMDHKEKVMLFEQTLQQF